MCARSNPNNESEGSVMEIKIGADELILWLRKTNNAVGRNNKDLGKEIRQQIESLGGILINEDVDVHWSNEGHNIGDTNLPKTAAQYTIDTSKLCKLYEWLTTL